MKRFALTLFCLLLLAGCSRKDPTPTSPPLPTATVNPSPLPSSTPTPGNSPTPRVTIVPSATRLLTAEDSASAELSPSPTGAVEVPPTSTLSATTTPRVINAGATATGSPTPTTTESPLPESPLPTPSPGESLPTSTRESTSPQDTALPSATTAEMTDTPSPTAQPNPSSTTTVSPEPTSQGEVWSFDNILTFYDEDFNEFYIWGEVVNISSTDQRITSLTPVVYDQDGDPITPDRSVDSLMNYESLLQAIRLAPQQSLAFSFLVYLPTGIPFEERYEIVVQAEPTEPARDDLDIAYDDFDMEDWPEVFYVEGAFANPGANLTDFVAVVVTVYDDDEHVIGVGWFFETSAAYLTTGEHDFDVVVDLWDMVEELGLDLYSYKVQVFGY